MKKSGRENVRFFLCFSVAHEEVGRMLFLCVHSAFCTKSPLGFCEKMYEKVGKCPLLFRVGHDIVFSNEEQVVFHNGHRKEKDW